MHVPDLIATMTPISYLEFEIQLDNAATRTERSCRRNTQQPFCQENEAAEEGTLAMTVPAHAHMTTSY